jgi:hypothetical protein
MVTFWHHFGRQCPEPIHNDGSSFKQPQFGSRREIVAVADLFPTAAAFFTSPHRAVSRGLGQIE